MTVTAKKRLEVRFKEEEFAKIKEIAKKMGKPAAAVVREAVDVLYEKLSQKERKKAVQKLAALKIELPSWGQLEEEIEKKYEDE